MKHKVGIVVIGRNEGKRLIACLRSLETSHATIVYVDSGSTDGSQATARKHGADVIDLDVTAAPFTAARARNAGFAHLKRLDPDVEFVQFIDGDCVLDEAWIPAALQSLAAQPDVAAACGRRREIDPERSIYNALCNVEWNTPVGEALAFGGDVMIRSKAFIAVRGFNDSLIAGEEPELALRLREQGWRILRLDQEMTLHDIAMTSLSQWWKRSVRAGHAFAEVAWMHRMSTKSIWKAEVVRALAWGLALPLAILALSLVSHYFLALFLAYPLQIARIALRSRFTGHPWAYASLMMVSKFAETAGIIRFAIERLTGRTARIIEYKGAAQTSEGGR